MAKVILEAASNHEGDMGRAVRMIEIASELGADIIKFQSYQAATLKSGTPEAEIKRRKKFELSDDDHHRLIGECKKNNIEFLTTCFDRGRVSFLKELGLKSIKIASPDCGSRKMLEELAEFIDTFYVSTGMSYIDDVDVALDVLRGKDVTLFHCVSLYPTPPEKAQLSRIDWLKEKHPKVGYSDHTLGVDVAKVALSRGIDAIEKHFTIDKTLPDFGQTFSIDIEEAKELIQFNQMLNVCDGEPQGDLQKEEVPAREKFVGIWGDNR